MYSMEWKYYAPVENRRYRGSRRFVPKLIEEKITEFVSHFRYIFSDINNKKVRINLINMGDCSDVFIGVAQYFEIHIYSYIFILKIRKRTCLQILKNLQKKLE